jgi:ABC-type proline/glycine betaine transport system permease subunit
LAVVRGGGARSIDEETLHTAKGSAVLRAIPHDLLSTRHRKERRRVMTTLLIVHHTPSPALHAMFDAVMSGATDDRIEGVEVVVRPALAATAVDVLSAGGYLLGTPANLGYMSGALKHFFDQVYYPCLEATQRRPYGLYVHGNEDTTGAVRAIETITTGLQWERAQEPVAVLGQPSREHLDACWELGAAIAAGLTL